MAPALPAALRPSSPSPAPCGGRRGRCGGRRVCHCTLPAVGATGAGFRWLTGAGARRCLPRRRAASRRAAHTHCGGGGGGGGGGGTCAAPPSPAPEHYHSTPTPPSMRYRRYRTASLPALLPTGTCRYVTRRDAPRGCVCEGACVRVRLRQRPCVRRCVCARRCVCVCLQRCPPRGRPLFPASLCAQRRALREAPPPRPDLSEERCAGAGVREPPPCCSGDVGAAGEVGGGQKCLRGVGVKHNTGSGVIPPFPPVAPNPPALHPRRGKRPSDPYCTLLASPKRGEGAAVWGHRWSDGCTELGVATEGPYLAVWFGPSRGSRVPCPRRLPEKGKEASGKLSPPARADGGVHAGDSSLPRKLGFSPRRGKSHKGSQKTETSSEKMVKCTGKE